MAKYEVIPYSVWVRDDGAQASIYGGLPYVSDAEKARWKVEQVGWSVRNPNNGQIGIGRKPCASEAEAIALVEKLGNAPILGFGD